MRKARSKGDLSAHRGSTGRSAPTSKNAPTVHAALHRKAKLEGRASADPATDQLLATLRLIDDAWSGSQAASTELAQGARAGMRELWSTYAASQECPAVELSDRQVDQLIWFYPQALRSRLVKAINDVDRIAAAEHQSNDGNRLLRLYRATRDLVTADTLPVSLHLWVALDRLDRAFSEHDEFRRQTETFVSKRLDSVMQRKRRMKANANPEPIYPEAQIRKLATAKGYFQIADERSTLRVAIIKGIVRELKIIERIRDDRRAAGKPDSVDDKSVITRVRRILKK